MAELVELHSDLGHNKVLYEASLQALHEEDEVRVMLGQLTTLCEGNCCSSTNSWLVLY